MERELFGEQESKQDRGPGPGAVVLPNRPTEVSETSVETIERKELGRRGAADLAMLLETLSSAHVRLNALGARTLSLRGFSSSQVRLLVDGLPAALAHDGALDLTLIPGRSFKQITVAKGTAPTLLPAGSLGGAVNFITRLPGSGPLVGGALEHGAHNAWRADLEHSLTLGDLAYTLHAGLYHQDAEALSRDFVATANERPALRENSDGLRWHVGAALRYSLGEDQAVWARARYIDGGRGVPPSTRAAQPDYLRMSTRRAVGVTLGHRATLGRVELDEVAYLRIHQRVLQRYDDVAMDKQKSPGSGEARSDALSVGGRLRGRTWADGTPWGLTFIRLAVSADHDRHTEQPAGGQTGPTHHRTVLSAGPEAEAVLSTCWSLTVGISLDLELPGEGDNSLGWGPLVSALYAPVESVALRGTVARRTRFPTLQERHDTAGGALAANPSLGPEKAWHMGLEATWRLLPGIALNGGIFDAEVADLIVRAPSGGGVQQLVNAASGRLMGVELGFMLSPLEQLHLSAAYSFLRARRTDDDAPDQQLAYRPMNKASMELVFSPWRFVELATFLIVHGERTYQDPATSAWGTLSPHAVWNARVAVSPVTWGSVYVRATNILGTHHVTEYGFPDPGRRIWLGLDLMYDRS